LLAEKPCTNSDRFCSLLPHGSAVWKLTPGRVCRAFRGFVPGRIFWISFLLRATEERVLREEISTVAIGALSSAAGAGAAMSVAADATAAATAVCASAGSDRPAAQAPSNVEGMAAQGQRQVGCHHQPVESGKKYKLRSVTARRDGLMTN
jgi:hypothetical protein